MTDRDLPPANATPAPTPAQSRPLTRLRAARAFTLVEMVIVMVLMTLLVVFVLPRLVGTSTFAEDQRAQATASGALDTMLRSFTQGGQGGRVTVLPPNTPAGCDLNQLSSPNNCVSFALVPALADKNGDVKFSAATTASTGSGVASVAAMRTTSGSAWRIGVAVLSPQSGGGPGTVSSCWMAWRNIPIAGAAASTDKVERDPLERYFVTTNIADGDATGCTATAALAHVWDEYCQRPPNGQPALGTSWKRPCSDYSS